MSAITKFTQISDALIMFNADICGESLSNSSVHSLEVHKEELKDIWQRVKPTYEKSVQELINSSDETAKTDLETVRARYHTTYSTYVDSVSKISGFIEAKKSAIVNGSTHANSTSSQVRSSHPAIHLPPCDTELFHGDYLSWPTFRDLFTAIYINNRHLSPVEKLFHLNNKTRNEAREIVRKAPLTNEGFDIAWKALQIRYDNKRLLINSQLKVLFNLHKISVESGNSIKVIQNTINSIISALKLYTIDISSWDPIFVYLCCTRLPENTLSLWEQSVNNKTECPTWTELDNFLTSRYQTLETVSDFSHSSSNSKSNDTHTLAPKGSNIKRVNSYQNSLSPPSCKLCPNQSHTIRLCPRFINMCYNDKMECIKKLKLCLNCFAKGHAVKDCKSAFNCLRCQRRHNTLLCISSKPSSASVRRSSQEIQSTSETSPQTPTETIQSCVATTVRKVLLGTAIIHILHRGDVFKARALFDSGSEASFISEHLFNLLNLKGNKISAQISGLNGSVSAQSHKTCDLCISSPINSAVLINTSAIVLPQLTSALPTFSANRDLFSNLPNIELADPDFYQTSYIDILIGSDLIPQMMLEGVKHSVCGSLMAQETIFGWILTGPIHNQAISSNHTIVSCYNEVELDQQISKFFEVEDLPKRKYMSEADKFCEKYFSSTTIKDNSGRYIVSLPFKEEFQKTLELGLSLKNATAQFFRNENRLLRNPELKAQYDNVIKEYLLLGHMKEVDNHNSDNCNKYYLPHHAVIRPDSVTTKVRVVFNASNPTSNGISLNDVLHCGPSLQLDLTNLLLQWRFYKIVFNSDIEKMYRQIFVSPNHTPFQRILYRDNPKNDIREYELQTVTFGLNCAPYLALRTMQQLAIDVKNSFPLASHILMSSMYVDDVMAGSHDILSAIQSQVELTAALGSAGFSLRKWTSNSSEFLKSIPKEHLLNEEFLQFEDSSMAKTLGVRWNAKFDHFYFNAQTIKSPEMPTKRQVLSEISKLFDPAGWLCPYIVIAKLLMRDIWASKIGWDDPLPEYILKIWLEFLTNYADLNRVKIPRWVQYTPDCEVELHGFCDASEKAYAAVIFLRTISMTGNVSIHLLTAKSRVSPLKTISIPKLELSGATLLAETIDSLMQVFPIPNIKIFCWTDSMIVLAWLKRPAFTWKTFVANRVSKICEIVSVENWAHVESKYNPADIASRGAYPSEIVENKLWWSGPSWLQLPPSIWPTTTHIQIEEPILERKILAHFTYFTHYDDPLNRFSSLGRALRVLSYVYRFIFKVRKASPHKQLTESIKLQKSDIESTRNALIILAQKVAYPNEYRSLTNKELISSSSSLLNLNPFVDSKGIMRVCSRIAGSDSLTYNEQYPIILPYNCNLSRLLLRFIHELTLHGGNNLILRMLRLQFWISRAKNLIKTTIHNCKTCVVAKHKLQTQLMGRLPPERTTLTRPFTNSGVDFAGPFDIKAYTGRSCITTKGYACIFVCFATKAIHLEVTSSLSTPAFLATFHRFVSRRGCPLNMYSDNGKNFVGASKELAQNFFKCSKELVTSQFSHQKIAWHFIPPGAPHMGGLWEAGVKSFKQHFRKMAGNHRFTFEEFSTILARIEACLNSRPISPMSENPNDILALTPGHFLTGGPILSVAESSEADTNLSVVNRWRKVKALSQQFSIRWKHEYIKELHKRNKWQFPQKNLEVGSMVVIRDDSLPPNEWRLGKISKIYHGNDKLVRVADVLTTKGILSRPLVKLVLLPPC